ncbi:CAP domain-containing protein [Flavivirga aquimarina]|uniref:CAP domain-containing protein n=1 Tax=Flavivirga aquimarina TaxID=2027862 RepID=A0ABT8W774_9FLAO|nr:CAP domain-containing protein [Flavivirga aquimarina]MDO5968917.1 CAP domain-containing protein [Flavivirga aquimarina]
MISDKLTLKTITLSFIIMSVLSCTTDKMEDNNLGLYNDIDLALVNENDWNMSNTILDLINKHRSEKGKSILKKDTLYATAYAVKHSKYMISTDNVSHDFFYFRSNGLKSKGVIDVSENVAYGYSSAQTVVNAWLKSEAHREVIEGDFSNIGFGVLKSSLKDRYYFTTLFYK